MKDKSQVFQIKAIQQNLNGMPTEYYLTPDPEGEFASTMPFGGWAQFHDGEEAQEFWERVIKPKYWNKHKGDTEFVIVKVTTEETPLK